jgi:hypothetical protein
LPPTAGFRTSAAVAVVQVSRDQPFARRVFTERQHELADVGCSDSRAMVVRTDDVSDSSCLPLIDRLVSFTRRQRAPDCREASACTVDGLEVRDLVSGF